MIQSIRIKHIIIKELKERKVRQIIILILLPFISGLFFIPRFFGLDDNFSEIITLLVPKYEHIYPVIEKDLLSLIIYTDLYLPVFIIIPAVTSPFLGVLEGVINEKEGRTLECLLSLPLSDSEILFAKMGGSILTAIGLTWFVYLIHLLFFVVQISNIFLFHLLSFKWIFLVAIFSPLLSFVTNAVGIILAIWLKKLNTAGNIGILILCPFFFFVFMISFGRIVLDLQLLLEMSLIFCLSGFILFTAAKRLFNREKLLLRY